MQHFIRFAGLLFALTLGNLLHAQTATGQPSGPMVDSITSDSAGYLVSLVSPHEDGEAWRWRFGNGDSATANAVNARYTEKGIYTIWLETTFADLTKDTLEHVLRLGIGSRISFGVENNKGRYPQDLKVKFTAEAPGATSFAWDFGDGSKSLDKNPVHRYSRVGKFPVSLVVAYPNGSTERTETSKAVELAPYITNDAVVFGILMLVLALVFYTSSLQSNFWKKLYTFVPAILLCYFIPALLNWPLNLIHGEFSSLYNPMASRYLLPASLVLLTLSVDYKGLVKLGPKALIMFLTATALAS
jgi:hypothetical protein